MASRGERPWDIGDWPDLDIQLPGGSKGADPLQKLGDPGRLLRGTAQLLAQSLGNFCHLFDTKMALSTAEWH
jgi:hypothetical protein